tara:strand:+ start:5862 stop:8864 length:3003 start_codon:yes stop_codon:yes gene_type:complete
MALGWYSDTGATAAITTTTVNTEVYAKLDFKQPDVRAVYLDWDDGVSNKTSESNFQWVTTTEPISSIVVPHTYNKTGNTFNPVVQTINSKGIISRYYSNEGSNSDVSPFSQLTSVSGVRVDDSNPTAIMRVENTTMNSGIDNSILETEGPQKVYIAIAPHLTQAELTGTIKQINVTVEGTIHRNKYDAATGTEAQLALGTDVQHQAITMDVNFASKDNGLLEVDVGTNENGAWGKISKVTFDSCKGVYDSSFANAGDSYATNEIFNRLKIFLVAKAADNNYYPITYVTAGCPVKTVDDNTRYSALNMGQSRAAASNVAISNYRYDNGKVWFSPVNQWSLSTNILGTETQITNAVKPIHYSYLVNPDGLNNIAAQEVFGATVKWYVHADTAIQQDNTALDDYGRFFPQYHNVRNSVLAASNSGSLITTNQPEVLLVAPSPAWTTQDPIHSGVDSFTTQMKNNGSSNVFKLANINTQAVTDIKGANVSAGLEQEYILLTFDSKTNKVFFNASNYANGLQSLLSSYDSTSGLKIAGVEYLHIENSGTRTQNAYWKPLEFKDTTRMAREVAETTAKEYNNFHTSFAKSGYISFDMPTDWDSISIKNLCGGVYNTTASSFSACTAAGTDDITVTGTVGTAASVTGYGFNIPVALSAAGDKTKMLTLGDDSDVGAYKYAFIIKSNHAASGAMFWLAKGVDNGFEASTGAQGTLYLQGGTGSSAQNGNWTFPTASNTITGTVRRVNIYDVVEGASKVWSDTGQEAVAANVRLMPVGAQTYNASAPLYFPNIYNIADADMTGSEWATNDKFCLKINLSGQTNDGASGNPCPELWNIFDANQGHSAIIEEVDDSAYSLNSIAITSDLSVGRGGQYFKAITRKGKVHIVKTGISMSEIGFSSVALGDESKTTAFADQQAATLYGHLHKVRNLQADAVPVYWDEIQKDGTFVRFWGIISNVNETRGTGGPKAIMNYTFTLIVKDIALIKNNGLLMTDRFPLGGLKYERDYS